MGAAAHLGIKPGEYDKIIATLIPHYVELIDAAAAAVDVDRAQHAGGRRSRHRFRRARAADSQGPAQGPPDRHRRRRGDAGGRAPSGCAAASRRSRMNFERARIPRCDVVSASFALHHIPTGGRKAALYKRCFTALRPGGMVVSADCYLANSAKVQQHHRQAWLSHLKRNYSREKGRKLSAHVGEGRRLLHARSGDRAAEGRRLRRRK